MQLSCEELEQSRYGKDGIPRVLAVLQGEASSQFSSSPASNVSTIDHLAISFTTHIKSLPKLLAERAED
ncbi:hypothetical protein V6N13_124858 [Hibiscus sabdariffa]